MMSRQKDLANRVPVDGKPGNLVKPVILKFLKRLDSNPYDTYNDIV